MPSNHFVVEALPAGNNPPNKALLRAGLVTRNAYCLTPAEDSRDFVMIDPDGGGTVPCIIQNGRMYSFDSTDTTTAHDGVLCLVSYDSQRYKLDDLSLPYSVLDKDLTAPPGSPALGDTYLIYGGSPTGAWAGKSGYLTVDTSRGWEFVLPPIGFRVLVEDENSFYFRDPDGDWVAGLGSVLVGPASIPKSALIWDGRVENQTRTAPPSTWSKGVAYIAAASSTGDWLGKDGYLMIAESDGVLIDGDTFAQYAPYSGLTAFDKNLGVSYRWSGSAWVSASGAIVNISPAVASGSQSTGLSVGSAYSNPAVAPTTSNTYDADPNTLTYAARSAGARLLVKYSALCTFDLEPSDNIFTIALFRDSETSAIAWFPWAAVSGTRMTVNVDLEFAANDASSHTYTIRIMLPGSTHVTATANRIFRIMEVG